MDDLIRSDLMRRVDARLTLEAASVLVGPDTLGPLALAASLHDGRVNLERSHAGLAGGTVDLQLAIAPEAGGAKAEVSTTIEHLDYGMLTRLLRSQTSAHGHLSLAATLRGQAADFNGFPARASGHIRFLLQPDALKAGAMTLWELNLLTLLLPKLDDSGSKINCIVGDFSIDNGVMEITPGSLIIDTSKIRASGEGTVDFKKQRIDLTLIPKVKSPRAFDLATSVKVSGDFADFAASITPGGLIQTIVGLPLGLNQLWLRFFNWNSIPPADGSDICGALSPAPAGPRLKN
jgi:uncharacterized protein involved in outer membrane biogenesis